MRNVSATLSLKVEKIMKLFSCNKSLKFNILVGATCIYSSIHFIKGLLLF